jgi:hypothetical protein
MLDQALQGVWLGVGFALGSAVVGWLGRTAVAVFGRTAPQPGHDSDGYPL